MTLKANFVRSQWRRMAPSLRSRPKRPVDARETGSHARPMIDLYYWPTPNGWKVTITLEELGLPYTIVPLDITRGAQLEPKYVAMNPNHRMPALVDRAPLGGGEPITV